MHKKMETEIWAVLLVILSGLIGAITPIFLKKASNKIRFRKFFTLFKSKYLFFGFLTQGLAMILFIPALKGGELSVLYPIASLSYIWISIYSIFLLNEKMSLFKWTGIATIVLGVSFIGLGA